MNEISHGQKKIADNIAAVTDEILRDYESGRNIDKLDVFSQPDRKTVIDLIGKLFRVVFPGFYKDDCYRVYNVKNNIVALMEDIAYLLNKQITVAIKYNPCRVNDSANAEECAEDITLKFFRQITTVRSFIADDVTASLNGDPAAFSEDEIIFSYPGIYAITVHRLAHELYKLDVPIIPRIMSEYAHSRTGIDIHPGAQIGRHFFIDHGTGIVIGETTTIGDNVKIYQGVTLGALSTKEGRLLKNVKRHPTIEDNVTIYSGASILGGKTVIGKGAVIGGNVFITKSVAPGTQISVKNQELRYDQSDHSVKSADFNDENAAWFYVI